MATLYWGGGTGTWDGFTTTNWYTDLARTVLAGRAPAADDDVIFDSSSHTTNYTVTISNNTTVCRSCTISGPASGTMTLAGSGQWYIYGNLTLPATGFTRTYTGNIYFYATDSRTITTNGVTLASPIFFAGTGGTWTLQDALNIGSSQIFLDAGAFNTNGKNLTCGIISATAALTAGTLTLGASTVSATTFSPNAPVVVNAGTSNITLSNAGANIGSGANYTGNTFYNVTFSSSGVTTCSIYGNNTFNNLTFTTLIFSRVSNVLLFGNQTVNGTLTISGGASSSRYFVRSDTIGTARTLTVATVGTLADVDFRDITVAGASSPWSGTRLGDCKGNTNITFVAGANKYIAGATGSSNWSANIWATSIAGTPAFANFPLAQDTIIIENGGLDASAILTLDNAYNIGNFDASGRSAAMSFNNNNLSPAVYGNVNVSPDVTVGNVGGTWTYAGRTTQNITTSGQTIPRFNVNSPGGTVKLLDATTTSGTISLVNGTFDANNQNVTASEITASGSASKTLTLGSGTITTTNGFGQIISTVSNLTVTSNTATVTCSSTSIIGFDGITASFGGTITVNGASSAAAIAGTTTVANLTISNAPTTTGVTDKLSLYGNLTVTGTLALAGGTSVTQRASVFSGALGTQRTLSAATVTGLTDIDFRDINATGAANWTTGTRLGDCGNNAGITFPAAKTVYWNLAGTQNWSATAWATTSTGTPAANNFPLAQDIATFTNSGATGTVTMQAFNIGTIDAGGRTSAWTLAGSGAPFIYGDVTYGSGITTTNTGSYTFLGRGTQTYTTAGKTVTNSFTLNKPAGTLQHGDAYTSSSTNNITITAGTYTTQNYNITANGYSSSNTNTRSITLGTSTLTLSGTTPVNFPVSTNLTFNGASSTINMSSTSAKTFNGGGQEFGTVSSTGGTTNPLTITGSNKFNTLTNTARTFLIFTSGTTQEVTNFTYSGAVGNVVRWYTSIPGQRATIKSSSATLAVGTNSTNGGNNTGLTFTGTSPDYFYVKDIAYSSTVISGGNFLMFFV